MDEQGLVSQTVTDRLLSISGFTCSSCGAPSPPQMHGRCDSSPVGRQDSEERLRRYCSVSTQHNAQCARQTHGN